MHLKSDQILVKKRVVELKGKQKVNNTHNGIVIYVKNCKRFQIISCLQVNKLVYLNCTDAVRKHKFLQLEPVNLTSQHSRQCELYGLIQQSPHILHTPWGRCEGRSRVDAGFVSQLKNPQIENPNSLSCKKAAQLLLQREVVSLLPWSGNKPFFCAVGRHYFYLPMLFAWQTSFKI